MHQSRDRFVTVCQQVLAVGAVLAVVAPATNVVSLDIVGPTGGAGAGTRHPEAAATAGDGALVADHPVDPEVREYPVGGIDHRALIRMSRGRVAGSAERFAPGRRHHLPMVALSAPQPVSGYATVGVTWRPGISIPDQGITVAVRTEEDGAWSDWTDIGYDAEHAPDPDTAEGRQARPGTDALLVGQVDQVQVTAYRANGTVPPGMRLAVVDPGSTTGETYQRPAIDTARLASAHTDGTATDPASTNPGSTEGATGPGSTDGPDTSVTGGVDLASGVTHKPQIFSRAQWGADERLRDKSSLHYDEVHAGFVHHTVNTNNYTRAQVPALLRGIYAYHTQSRGWSDIGYNFLVDRFGRIWEGRYGGVDRPVVGAHTLHYNEYSFAMSAIGNYDKARPSRAMIRAYGRLFAWKLSLHGVDAASTRQWVGSRYFQAINGHRDAAATACPGRYLYAKIPRIRRLAASHQASWAERRRHTDLSGSSWPDLVVRQAETHAGYVVHTDGQLRFGRPTSGSAGWAGDDVVAVSPDFTGDGDADVIARDADSGNTALYPGDGDGGFGSPVRRSHRFHGMDQIVPVGDLNGDGHHDLLARAVRSHKLFLFRGRAHRFAKRIALAPDWRGYDLTVGTGDLTGDGRDDFVARDTHGKLWLFPGTGRATLGVPQALPRTWRGYDQMTGFHDFTGDGLPDLVARKNGSRSTFVFPGDGAGSFGHWLGPFSAFRKSAGINDLGDVTGDGSPDILLRRGDKLLVVPTTGGRNVGSVVDPGLGLNHTNAVLNVGDWNGDGINDVMTRTPTGVMKLREGRPDQTYADPVVAGRGWRSVRLLTAVGDVTGDGHPDLMGQPKGGAMRLYPGDGRTGFRAGYVAHSPIGAAAHAGVGLWDGDGAPDTMFRSGKALVLFPGNGPGGLTGGRQVAGHAKRYDWVLGPGDLDGDGHPDLVVRTRSTGDLWLLPGTGHGLGHRRFLAEGFGGYDLAG